MPINLNLPKLPNPKLLNHRPIYPEKRRCHSDAFLYLPISVADMEPTLAAIKADIPGN